MAENITINCDSCGKDITSTTHVIDWDRGARFIIQNGSLHDDQDDIR